MAKKYPIDKLFVAKPWIVERDYSINHNVLDKMVVKASGLEQLLTASEINNKFPNADIIEIHTVVLSQGSEPKLVMPTINGYQDVLDGTIYEQSVDLLHCDVGEIYVLSDQHPGVKVGMNSIIDILSSDNEFLRDYLLTAKLKLTQEDAETFMEMFMKKYKEQKTSQKPKMLTLRNYIIYENGQSRFERF